MTTSAVTNPNGSARKTLASQLDRLDDILTGLSEALSESVSTAVEKAVAGVLTEILTNPSFAERLRGRVILPLADNAMADVPLLPAQPRLGLRSKIGAAFRAGCRYVRQAASAVLRRGVALANTGRAYLARMLSRGRALACTAALLSMGLAAYFAGSRLLPVLTGVVSRLCTLGTRLRSSLRHAGIGGVPTAR
jgi:hypothetical protein